MEAINKTNNINLKVIFILIALVLSILIVHYVIKAVPHPFLKHGESVQGSMNCLDSSGSYQAFKFFENDEERRAFTCYDGDWYIIFTTTAKGTGIDREYELRTAHRTSEKGIRNTIRKLIKNGGEEVDEILEPHELFFEWK